MNKFEHSVSIEKETFIMCYEKGKFSINALYDGEDENGNKFPSLSKHLSVNMPCLHTTYQEDQDDCANLLGLTFLDMFNNMSYINENLADKINKLMEEAQRVVPKKGRVYLVSDGQFVKIGGTKNNLQKRVNELQTGNPRKLIVLGSYETLYLLQSERLVQNMYKELNVLNEWFNLSDIDINDILSNKPRYKDNPVVKKLSHTSNMNILSTQFILINDVLVNKIKVYKRKLRTTTISSVSPTIIDKVRKLKDNEASIKYVSKFNAENQLKSFDILKRLIKEIDSLVEYSKFIQKAEIDYMKNYKIYYDDDAYIYKFIDTEMEVI